MLIYDKMKRMNNKIKGYVMAVTGFLMILINAINYLISDKTNPTLLIIGLVFVVIGMGWTKK